MAANSWTKLKVSIGLDFNQTSAEFFFSTKSPLSKEQD